MLHFHLQRRLGGVRSFERGLSVKVDDWAIMARHLRNAGVDFSRMRGFAIGTGWYPTFPFACYLAGARKITTCALNPHLREDLTRACVGALETFLPATSAAADADPDAVAQRSTPPRAPTPAREEPSAASGGALDYHAPADAASTALGDGEVDVVFSNSVLEHVPEVAIDTMYREAMRILAPGGIMFHSVNCGDHYAYVDRSIHQLHYLKYSDRQWRFWDNAFLYQNRLRAHCFVDSAAERGFDIEMNTAKARPERPRQLSGLPGPPLFPLGQLRLPL